MASLTLGQLLHRHLLDKARFSARDSPLHPSSKLNSDKLNHKVKACLASRNLQTQWAFSISQHKQHLHPRRKANPSSVRLKQASLCSVKPRALRLRRASHFSASHRWAPQEQSLQEASSDRQPRAVANLAHSLASHRQEERLQWLLASSLQARISRFSLPHLSSCLGRSHLRCSNSSLMVFLRCEESHVLRVRGFGLN